MTSPPPSPPPSQPAGRYKIGYALAAKKRKSFIQPSLISLARDRGIDLIEIDADRTLSSQGPFDCVLQKLSGEDWESQLLDYAMKNPGVPIVDQPDAIEQLHNRISMLQFVSDLDIPQGNETFGIPKQIVVYDKTENFELGTLKFPLIAKPLVADGSAKSHKMVLVLNREGLLELNPPIVLQEFVNHGGVIFKIYVVGDHVKCVKRKSLSDVTEEKLECAEGCVRFSQVSNMTTRYKSMEKYYKTMQLEDAEMPPLTFITDIARGLRKATGLHLFNFDVIRDVKVGNHYLIVDINYFPGYAKMPSYETVLTDFFWEIVHKTTVEKEKDSLDFAHHANGKEVKKISTVSCEQKGNC